MLDVCILGRDRTLANGPDGLRTGGICGALRLPRWAIATAIVMLPYFAYAVMELLVNPSWRLTAGVFAALTIGVFLSALDVERRR